MKLGYADIEKFLGNPEQARGVLFYGPNAALIEQRLQNMMKKLLPHGDDGFNVVTMTPDQVKQTSSLLADELATMSFFGGRKVILFKDVDDKHVPLLADALSLPPSEHYLILLADELSARSALRLWAEKDKAIAAVPCYEYDLRDMARILQQHAQAQNARLDRDASDLLVQVLGTQAEFIPLTITRLIDYAGTTPAVITAEMVRACCVDQTDATTDDLIQDVMNGQVAPLQRHLQHYYAAGESSVGLLRMLQNYLYRLKTVKAALQDGQSPDQALMSLKPPVFFKQKQSFLQHVQRWSDTTLDRWLTALMETEAACKQTGAPDELLVRQLALDMATDRR